MARNTNGKGFSLKDHLFNKDKVTYLAGLFSEVHPEFKNNSFVMDVMTELPQLELKARITHIAIVLQKYLPEDFLKATKIIVQALPEPLAPDKTDDDFGDFIFAPLGEYVVRNGLEKKYLKTSLATLKEITQRFSMEDAIRYFISAFEEDTLAELQKWTTHKHYHVRRLVSEGTRPLLPWSKRIPLDITLPIVFLDQLYFDNTRFVTRSVANHINDISKTNPRLALDTLDRWRKEGKQNEREMEWIMAHALRTLIKQGNAEALVLLGYESSPKIKIVKFATKNESQQVTMGEALTFSFEIQAEKDEKLMIDYIIHFMKKNGSTSSKVFKIKNGEIKKGESMSVVKNHVFLKDATSFTLYPGIHTLVLQINGQHFKTTDFYLL